MTKNKKEFLLLGAAVIILGGLVYFFLLSDSRLENTKEKETMSIDKSTSTEEVSAEFSEGEGEVHMIKIDKENTISQPDLERPIVYPDFYTEEAQALMEKKITDTIALIKEDPTSFANWVELAIERSDLEDYEGAVEIYEYLNKAAPNNSLSFVNLGTIEHLYLHQYEDAEKNMLQAIKNNPQNMHAYRSLHELYRYSYKQDTNAAVDIILDALKEFPNNIDFFTLLAVYYRDTGEKDKAIEYYDKAIDQAIALGNNSLVLQITAERNALANNKQY